MDDRLSLRGEDFNFFSVHKIREYLDDLDDGNEDTYVSVFIRLDNAFDIYER